MNDIVKHEGSGRAAIRGEEMFFRLRQPFEDSALKWKIQTNPKEGDGDMFALCVAYIDARDVAARLNEVVGIDWESSFGDIISFTDGKKTEHGVRCHLTVMGHTRTDIGTLPATEPLKGGYSDALKRAAVQFGIAAYVYAFPTVKAEVQKFGRSYYFTPNAKKELIQLVQAIHASADRLPKFHALQVRNYAPILFDSPYFGGEEGQQPETEPESVATVCEGCGSPIMDYKSMTADVIEEKSRAAYDMPLCWGCALKAKAAKEAAQKAAGGPQKAESAARGAQGKEAAKNALLTARQLYEAAAVNSQILGFSRPHNPDYLQWDTARLNMTSDEIILAIQEAIHSAALESDKFLSDEDEGLPSQDASLEEWMKFAEEWGLIDSVRENAKDLLVSGG